MGLAACGSCSQVFAMGSQDCRITVWSSGAPRPIMVLKKAFDKTVVDLAWSADGRTLLCASLDGSVLAATFDPTELGQQVSAAEMGGILRGMYGEHSVGRSAAQGATQLAEDPLVLEYEAAAGAANGIASTPAASPLAPSPASARVMAVAVRSSPLGAAAASSSPAAPQVRTITWQYSSTCCILSLCF
jgi:protein HIRA/HIR1